jgi:hypothetical protein
MPKYSSKNPMNAPGGGSPMPGPGGGGSNWLAQARALVNDIKEGLQLYREVQGMAGNQPAADQGGTPLLHQPKRPAGPNPALAKFMAKYGDRTVNDLLKMIGPMTLKELESLMQHGN